MLGDFSNFVSNQVSSSHLQIIGNKNLFYIFIELLNGNKSLGFSLYFLESKCKCLSILWGAEVRQLHCFYYIQRKASVPFLFHYHSIISLSLFHYHSIIVPLSLLLLYPEEGVCSIIYDYVQPVILPFLNKKDNPWIYWSVPELQNGYYPSIIFIDV